MKNIILAGIVLVFTVISCNNTQLLSSWKSPDAQAEHYDKILVIGLTGSKDGDLKQPIETAVAKRLQDAGINVETATQQYGPKSFRTMSEEQAVKLVNDNGF